jgi:hypothetical protein
MLDSVMTPRACQRRLILSSFVPGKSDAYADLKITQRPGFE